MIHETHRFHGRGSLNFVYKNGKTIRGTHDSLKYVRNTRRKTYRVAVVVSRKVHKSAVVRNRIRRRLYEIIRERGSLITEPYDIILTAFSEQLATADHRALVHIIEKQLDQAGIISVTDKTEHGIVGAKENHS